MRDVRFLAVGRKAITEELSGRQWRASVAGMIVDGEQQAMRCGREAKWPKGQMIQWGPKERRSTKIDKNERLEGEEGLGIRSIR